MRRGSGSGKSSARSSRRSRSKRRRQQSSHSMLSDSDPSGIPRTGPWFDSKVWCTDAEISYKQIADSGCVMSKNGSLNPRIQRLIQRDFESGASKFHRTSTSPEPPESDRSRPEHSHRRYHRVPQLVASFATAKRPHWCPHPGSTASSVRMVCVPCRHARPKQSLTSWSSFSAQRTSGAQERRAEAQGRQVWTRSSYHQPESQGGKRSC